MRERHRVHHAESHRVALDKLEQRGVGKGFPVDHVDDLVGPPAVVVRVEPLAQHPDVVVGASPGAVHDDDVVELGVEPVAVEGCRPGKGAPVVPGARGIETEAQLAFSADREGDGVGDVGPRGAEPTSTSAESLRLRITACRKMRTYSSRVSGKRR